jgi:hypothetical protein
MAVQSKDKANSLAHLPISPRSLLIELVQILSRTWARDMTSPGMNVKANDGDK